MPIIRYQPINMLNQMHEEMNRILHRNYCHDDERDNSAVATSQWSPAVDIVEESNRFVLFADVPGVDPKAIEIFMDDGALTVKGERVSENKEERTGYKRMERCVGSFYRRFNLPDTADGENITAQSKNGVLEIVIPKKEKSKSRKIEVQ